MELEEFYKYRFSRLDRSEALSDRLYKVLEVFSHHRFYRVLDVGCGDGEYSNLIKEACKSKEVFGIEISNEGVKLSEAKGIRAFRLDAGVDRFPFVNDFFDAVFCGEVIEHIFDPDNMLLEIKRVLKPNGLLIITTPNLASWLNRVVILFGFQPYYTDVSIRQQVGKLIPFADKGSGHIRVFTLKALRELLEINNFEVVNIIGAYHYEAKKISILLDYMERLMSIYPPLSSTIIVIAKNDKDI